MHRHMHPPMRLSISENNRVRSGGKCCRGLRHPPVPNIGMQCPHLRPARGSSTARPSASAIARHWNWPAISDGEDHHGGTNIRVGQFRPMAARQLGITDQHDLCAMYKVLSRANTTSAPDVEICGNILCGMRRPPDPEAVQNLREKLVHSDGIPDGEAGTLDAVVRHGEPAVAPPRVTTQLASLNQAKGRTASVVEPPARFRISCDDILIRRGNSFDTGYRRGVIGGWDSVAAVCEPSGPASTTNSVVGAHRVTTWIRTSEGVGP